MAIKNTKYLTQLQFSIFCFMPLSLYVEAILCTKSWLYGFEGNLIFFYSHNYTILILY